MTLFIYGDGNKTFAEMDMEAKSRISHGAGLCKNQRSANAILRY